MELHWMQLVTLLVITFLSSSHSFSCPLVLLYFIFCCTYCISWTSVNLFTRETNNSAGWYKE